MYANAWQREIAAYDGAIRRKGHHIDAMVLTTRDLVEKLRKAEARVRELEAAAPAQAGDALTDCGHGHVHKNANGIKARCGGPGLCKLCARDLAAMSASQDKKPGASHAANAGAVMMPLSAGLPSPDEHDRVLVYTDGVDFAGEQYFDIKTEKLWETDPEAKTEVAEAATHWMPHPDRAAIASSAAQEAK
jgi:hypothetical protein